MELQGKTEYYLKGISIFIFLNLYNFFNRQLLILEEKIFHVNYKKDIGIRYKTLM